MNAEPAAKKQPYQPQPPATEREDYWSTIRCRDLSSNVGTEYEVTRTHRFGIWSPGYGDRRCDGCDRTAKMLDGGVR